MRGIPDGRAWMRFWVRGTGYLSLEMGAWAVNPNRYGGVARGGNKSPTASQRLCRGPWRATPVETPNLQARSQKGWESGVTA